MTWKAGGGGQTWNIARGDGRTCDNSLRRLGFSSAKHEHSAGAAKTRFMTPEQRQELMRLLSEGSDVAPEWARILFPLEKREYELVYHGKERDEDIVADAL